jgi:ferredoxin
MIAKFFFYGVTEGGATGAAVPTTTFPFFVGAGAGTEPSSPVPSSPVPSSSVPLSEQNGSEIPNPSKAGVMIGHILSNNASKSVVVKKSSNDCKTCASACPIDAITTRTRRNVRRGDIIITVLYLYVDICSIVWNKGFYNRNLQLFCFVRFAVFGGVTNRSPCSVVTNADSKIVSFLFR